MKRVLFDVLEPLSLAAIYVGCVGDLRGPWMWISVVGVLILLSAKVYGRRL